MSEPSSPSWYEVRYWRWAWGCVIALVIAHTLIRCIYYRNLDVDEAEQLVLIQELSLGYSAQPPLYTWLVWGMAELAGPNVVAVALVKAGLMLTLFFQMMQLGRWCFTDRRALLVFCIPLLLPLYAWEAWRMTHTPILTILCLATMLNWLRLLRSPTWTNYLSLGCCFGLGMLTKYNYALFAGASGLALLLLPATRRLILTPRFLLSLLVSALVVLPHAWWAWGEQQAILDYLRSRTGSAAASLSMMDYLQRLGFFLYVLIITGGIPMALVFILDWKLAWTIRWPRDTSIRFILLTIIISLVLYVAAIFTGRMYHFRGHWLGPILLLAPIWLLSYVPPITTWHRPASAFLGAVALMSLAILGIHGSGMFLGYSDGKFQTRDYLFASLVSELSEKKVQAFIAGDIHTAGYLRLYYPHLPVHCCNFLNNAPKLATDQSTIVVWDGTPEKGYTIETPVVFQRWLEQHITPSSVKRITTTPRRFHTRTTRLAYACLHP